MPEFYTSPGQFIEPGDVFSGIPFPSLRYPLEFFRPRLKPKELGTADIFNPQRSAPKSGDSPRSTLELKRVMFLSHGCEVERVERFRAFDRRFWLAAPVVALDQGSAELQQRTREGKQPNKFHLPPGEYLGQQEFFVDLRKITPINCRYFLEGQRLCSLTDAARLALQSQLGVFFSGLALYVQPIACPQCGLEIDPTQFLIDSGAEEDVD